jgi:hypothetical protein
MVNNQLEALVPAPLVSATDLEAVARWFQSEDAGHQLAMAAAFARGVIEEYKKASVIPPEELYRPITLA